MARILQFGVAIAWGAATIVSAFDPYDNLTEIVSGPQRITRDDAYPVFWRRPLTNDAPRARYPGFNQSTTLLKNGTVRRSGARALSCDIILERDVPVTLRDGTVMYTDVYRPVGNETVPAIVGWSPYGKEIGGQWLDDVTNRSGVPLSHVSELQKFEGADPAYWVAHGYAVLNPDSPGAYMSGGNLSSWGTQLGREGYDFVEWAASQSWSNQKVAFSGNSYLSISQWFIAAEQPPHLAAIAPWEGFYDVYRHNLAVGGVPAPAFSEAILTTFAGLNLMEDIDRMLEKEPLISLYWEDKVARLDKINVPAYVVGSYLNTAHTLGTFKAWQKLGSEKKWLRVHNTSEWPDYYATAHVEDLRLFFDRYLKDINNTWEQTPRVRNAILNPGGVDILGEVATDWPPTDVQPMYLYPQPNGSLGETGTAMPWTAQYSMNGTTSITFNLTVPEQFDLIGFSKAHLWVEAVGSNDMDFSVSIEKRTANGIAYPVTSAAEGVTVIAAAGHHRVSRRNKDDSKSTLYQPYYTFDRNEYLQLGQIVPVDIEIWPMGLRFEPGQRLVLTISAIGETSTSEDLAYGTAIIPVPAHGGTFEPGQNVTLLELGGNITSNAPYINAQRVRTPDSANRGAHTFHFGGQYDSYVVMPTRQSSSSLSSFSCTK